MRFNEVKKLIESEQDLFEINMSPSSLKKLSSNVKAIAGMEFEMIVPDAKVDDEPDYQPDYDMDTRSRDFDDIRNFFYDGDYNSRRDVDNLMSELTNSFTDWADEQLFESWQDEGIDYLRDYIDNNGYFDDDEANEEATKHLEAEYGDKLTPEEFATMRESYVRELFDQFVQDQWDNEGSYYESAKEEYFDEQRGDQSERDWLNENYPRMTDIQNHFDIQWPYYYDANQNDGEVDIADIAADFEQAVGMKVNYSSSYHGGRRESDAYVVEPDGSLDPDNSEDAGLEFVSPPMPIDQLLVQLDKVKSWADSRSCYTNRSTGLHINVSVPGIAGNVGKNVDYVKLALLLGDEYVLNEFGRSANSYTESAMKIIRNRISQRPEDAEALLNTMRKHLDASASKIIHSGHTKKYTSINTKEGYIEFRSPGGNWLDEDLGKLENTLLRFVVALDAATDPTKYREEYLKKLYAVLKPKSKNDTIGYFAQYAAGQLPKSALKSFIKQAQLERKVAKDPTGGQKYWWSVSRPGYFASIEVVATSKEEAIDKALEPGNYPDWASARNTLQAKPIKPYDSSPVRARVGEPQAIGRAGSLGAIPGYNTPSQTDYENRLGWPDQTGDANYEIINRGNNSRVMVFIANTEQDALRKYNQWLDLSGFPHDAPMYGFREIARPGSTLDLQRQRSAQQSQYEIYRISDGRTVEYNGRPMQINATSIEDAEERARQAIAAANLGAPELFDVRSVLQAPAQVQREFTGAWIVRDPEGREIHRITGIGNVQSDANRHAMNWLRQNPEYMRDGVDVVPEMR